MVSCYLDYTIDTFKIKEFITYAKMWIPLVNKFGGQHHGYFLPHEGASNKAYALFSFSSLAAYENYRIDSLLDDDCIKAYAYADETKCIISYKRNFLKPIFN
ncbi:NIPSNAP family protein [uncultured Aquimarina sp.]|uniref:NIPSNAP family protein n=1 Tax=uncultured Aquimarina sp. TaxID=575652 RepID=UPI00260CA5E5|nr:NIPSNAP family protein [uncultured Aquimarina sp.]